MKKKTILNLIIFLTLTTLCVIAPNKVKASTLIIKADKGTLKPGESTMVTVSSDSKGRVNLKVSSNAEITGDRVSLNGDSQSFKLTAKQAGKVTLTATPQKPMTLNGNEVTLNPATCTLNIVEGEENKNNQSTNVTLANLGIKPNDFKGFSPNKNEYFVTVPTDVKSIEIYAKKGKEGQKIEGIGKKELQEGKNTFNITVTAEDGKTSNTYVINITRETTATENITSKEETNIELGLKTLKIEGVSLVPEFKKDVYEYETKLIGEKETLEIETEALDESEKIEILGNENLKEGQNIISILVSDQEGENTITYQITVNKSLVDKEKEAKAENIKKSVIIGSTIIVITILLIILIKKKRKNEEFNYGYDNEYIEPYVENKKENQEEIIEENIEEEKPKKKKSKGKRFK